MKQINKSSEQMLLQMHQLLNNVEVKGHNVFDLGNAITILKQVLEQINAPPEEGEKAKEE